MPLDKDEKRKRDDRRVLTFADFSDEDRAAVAAAQPPVEAADFDDEFQDATDS